MVSSHKIPTIAILCIFLVAIQQVHQVGRGREKRESNSEWRRKEGLQLKKWCPSYKFFYIVFSVTRSFLLLSFLVSHEALIILQWARRRAHPRKTLPVYPKELYHYTSIDISWCNEAAIYAKKPSFISFYSFLMKFSE